MGNPWDRPTGNPWDRPTSDYGGPSVSGSTPRNPNAPGPDMAAEDVLPYLGGMAGGLVGGGVGIPGGIVTGGTSIPFGATIGAGIGGQVGETARQYVRALRDKPVEPTAVDALKKTFGEGGKQAGAQLFGAALVKPFTVGARLFTGGATPAANQVTKTAESMGIDLPIGARTESPGVLATEASLIRRLGGEKVAEVRKVAEKKLGDVAEGVAGKYGQQREPLSAGLGVQKAFKSVLGKKNAQSRELFDELDKTVGGADGSTNNTSTFLSEFLNKQGKLDAKGKIVSRVPFYESPQVQETVKLMDYLSKGKLTYSDIKTLRTQISSLADNESIKASGAGAFWKKVQSELTKDLAETAEKAGKGDVAGEAMSFYRDYMNFLDQPASKTIHSLKNQPEKIIDSLVGKNSPSNVKTLFKNFDEEGKNYIRRRVMDRVMENSVDETVPGGRISPSKFSKQLNQYTDETIDALFGKNATDIRNLRDVSNAMARGENLRSGSPTSILDDVKDLLTLNPFPAISRIGSRMGMSSMLASPGYRKFVSGNPAQKIERVSKVAQRISGLASQLGAGAIRNWSGISEALRDDE